MGAFSNFKTFLGSPSGNLGEHGTTADCTTSENARSAQFSRSEEQTATLAALDRVQAIIEFALDGTIITANRNFLNTMGYSLAELQGRHHSMFMEPGKADEAEYHQFWDQLRAGQFRAGVFKRIGKLGRVVYINASYNPVLDALGNVIKIIKFATDVTQQRLQSADDAGQLAALHKSQAVIEFTLDGVVITANDSFLKTLGYSLAEIQGKHHSMFVEPAYRGSAAYQEFWARLRRGEYDAREYKRIGKNGREVWINATYNPIFDPDGKPCKVVKFATDVTEQKMRFADMSGQMEAIHKSQAVIEFKLDGTILHANENFLQTVGYSLNEIQGRHHSMFVDQAVRRSPQYIDFWAKLARGEYAAGEFQRQGKGDKAIWIQGSYNPILDADGRVYKVVKYATDVTAQKELQQTIANAMRDAGRVMKNLSEGKLSDKMAEHYSGEFAELSNAVNSFIDRFVQTVREIQGAALSVRESSAEIASGNANLSQRTEQQSSSLEETSAAMEELTTTVQQNAENARQANLQARSAREAAERGGSIVGNAITAMEAISQASKRINDIIGVIDEIAFQTNLLALNAAVEAARAGEQGRGFAVVASEVRGLAGRSSTAAKEIKALILDSNEKVKEGYLLVNNSGQTLKEITLAVSRVNDIIAEIATASSEQANGINEISKAVLTMDENTQQNAALVEEAAAASESLNGQAEAMESLMRFFELPDHRVSDIRRQRITRDLRH